jgi:hypothetical protein
MINKNRIHAKIQSTEHQRKSRNYLASRTDDYELAIYENYTTTTNKTKIL